MITVNGSLQVRTIHGRNGPFNVATLTTDIGAFWVKDAEIDMLPEGSHSGQFVISRIYLGNFPSAGGRITIEVRAVLADMQLYHSRDENEETSTFVEQDPLDEVLPVPPDPMPPVPVTPESVPELVTGSEDPDGARLFGELWPLGECVQPDPTDRQRLREQMQWLRNHGYQPDARTQSWVRQP